MDNTRDTEQRTATNHHPGINVVDFHGTAPSGNSAISPTSLMDIPRPMERQCTAKSKQSGVRCKRRPIPGGHVCVMHGGKTPGAIASAKARLALLVDPAILRLATLIDLKGEPGINMAAVRDVLDRNGFKPVDRVEVTDSGARYQALAAGRERARLARVILTERTVTLEGPELAQVAEKKDDNSKPNDTLR